MNGLMLHCGALSATEEEVKSVMTPEPIGRHYPVGHWELVESTLSVLHSSGMKVSESSHGLTSDGSRYFGLMKVESEDFSNEDFSMVLGLRNAHDKRFRASVAFGNRVFVCDNLCFSGEAVVGRRHTRNIRQDLPGLLTQAVGMLGAHHADTYERMTAYRQKRISRDTAYSTIVQSIQKGVLPQSKLLKVVEEYENPTHSEFTEDGNSLWRLQNAITEVSKGRNLFNLPKAQHTMLGILDPIAGYVGSQSFTAEVV